MKAITVQQPWAWCIAAGHKLVENRSWVTSYRGPLAIHAGKTWDLDNVPVARQALEDMGVVKPGVEVGDRHLLATGAVVAVVDLVGVCTDSARCYCGRWAPIGLNHWKLDNVAALPEPIPVRGRQGLWDLDVLDPR